MKDTDTDTNTSVPAIHRKTWCNSRWPCLYYRIYLLDFFISMTVSS